MSLLRAPWAGITALVWLLAFAGCAATQEKGYPSKGLSQAWSLRGDWTGVTSNSGTIYASSLARKRSEIDTSGKPSRSFAIPGGAAEEDYAGPVLRLAHFSSGIALVAFGTWSGDVRAL